MTYIKTILWLVCGILLLTAAVQAQGGHSIRGKARNAAGKNLAQVFIDLQNSNGVPVGQTTTNNEGDFQFSNLTDSGYTVTASSSGYNSASEQVRFIRMVSLNAPGETQTIELTLTPVIKERSLASPEAVFVQNVPPPAREALETALKLIKDGKASEALVLIEKAIELFPEYFDAHLAYSFELIKLDKLDEAIKELEKARQINPKDGRLYKTFGSILMKQKKFSVAAAVFAEAVRLNPKDTQSLIMRAEALIDSIAEIDRTKPEEASEMRKNLLDEAEKSLERAASSNQQKLPEIYLQMARVYEKRGNGKRAAAELEQYLKTVPTAPNAQAIREAIAKLREQK